MSQEWNGQPDWGPRYVGWWEICEECDGLYNWFNVEVIEGLTMYGWIHVDPDDQVCVRVKPIAWGDTRRN